MWIKGDHGNNRGPDLWQHLFTTAPVSELSGYLQTAREFTQGTEFAERVEYIDKRFAVVRQSAKNAAGQAPETEQK